jgi:hypothetical protein
MALLTRVTSRALSNSGQDFLLANIGGCALASARSKLILFKTVLLIQDLALPS